MADIDIEKLAALDPSIAATFVGEDDRSHRAFLLYAMQDPGIVAERHRGRSIAAVGTVTGLSRQALNRTSKVLQWDARITKLGSLAMVEATRAYHALYFERYGDREVMGIAARMTVPWPPEATPSGQVAAKIDEMRAQSSNRTKKQREKIRDLLDGTLVRFGKALVDDRVSFRAGDLIHLARAVELAREPDPSVMSSSGSVSVESVRLRVARATGADLMDAAWQDVEDLRVLLSHLRAGRAAADCVAAETSTG